MNQPGKSYGVWVVTCLLAAALLLVIAAALLAERGDDRPEDEWETLNREIEQTIGEWRSSQEPVVSYPLVNGKIPINSAPAAQLETLPGIGPSKAAAIVAYREEHGPFASVEDVVLVKGIGAKTLDNLRNLITVEQPEQSDQDERGAAEMRDAPSAADAEATPAAVEATETE